MNQNKHSSPMDCPMLSAIQPKTFQTILETLQIGLIESEAILRMEAEPLQQLITPFNEFVSKSDWPFPEIEFESFIQIHTNRKANLSRILQDFESIPKGKPADLSGISIEDRDMITANLALAHQTVMLFFDVPTKLSRKAIRIANGLYKQVGIEPHPSCKRALRNPKRYYAKQAESLVEAMLALNPDGSGCGERDCMCA